MFLTVTRDGRLPASQQLLTDSYSHFCCKGCPLLNAASGFSLTGTKRVHGCNCFGVFFLINLFIYFWLHWVLVAACGPLIVVAYPVAEHGF